MKLKGEKGNEYSNTIPKEITPELLRMSPMDTIEKVYTLMGVHNIKGEDEYLSKFMDTAKDFFSDFHNGIEDFVEKWDDTSDKNNLQDTHIENEDAKGVVAMTIHKSKGLQFKNVIVPLKGLYDRNNSGQKQENLWCSTVNKGNPFDTIPFAAIQTQKSMKDSLFKKEYEENELMKKMDDLNVMYVAFTRAEDNLYLIGESSNVDNEKKAERLILNALTDEFNKDEFNKDKDTEKEIYGPFYIKNDISANRENENKTNPFNPTIKKQPIEFTSNDRDLEIWQSGESKLFVNNKDKRNDFVEIGNIIHALFAKIKTLDDIDNVLDYFKYNGTIISKEDIKKHIEKSIKKNGNIKEWFDKKWTLFNECSIIELDNDGTLVNKNALTSGSTADSSASHHQFCEPITFSMSVTMTITPTCPQQNIE